MSQISAEGIDTSVVKKWKRYPAYKDSGVEWLGEIPEHWKVLSVRRLAGLIEQGWSPVAEDRLASEDEWGVIKLSAVSQGLFRPEEHKTLPENVEADTRYEIQTGDFLLTRANTPNLVGDVCVVSNTRPQLMLCDLVYRVSVDDNRISRNYLCYWFLSRVGRYQITCDARGSSLSMVKVSQNSIRSWLVALPPYAELKAIASFLDRETAKIDALIAKKERLIKLLQEKRTAIISHAVTKGLDPTVPLEDSGVDWLGEVPGHWEVKRIKYLAIGQNCGIQMGPFGGLLKDLSVEETGFKVYGQENTINDDFTAGHRWITYKQLLEMARYSIRKGDLLLTRKGSIGKCRVVPDDVIPGIIDSDTIRVRVNEDQILKGFLVRLMHEAWYLQEQIVWNSRGAIVTGLNTTTIAELRVAVPPLSEQKAIASYLDRETTKIDALIAKIREGIEKLKEYRTALISSAVTGTIDVRELTD
jgi:type I restriction enzyme S subunit